MAHIHSKVLANNPEEWNIYLFVYAGMGMVLSDIDEKKASCGKTF